MGTAEQGGGPGQDHHDTFCFPLRPAVSTRCQSLLCALITDKQARLCSRRYQIKDQVAALAGTASSPTSPSSGAASASPASANVNAGRPRDFAGRYVFPYDAEDIKAHRWFRGLPWDRLHTLPPPFQPRLRTDDDTQYFEEEDTISDWESSSTSSASEPPPAHHHRHRNNAGPVHPANIPVTPPPAPYLATPTPPLMPQHQYESPVVSTPGPAVVPALRGGGLAAPPGRAAARDAEMAAALEGFPATVRRLARAWAASPHDDKRLRVIDGEIAAMPDLHAADREALRRFVRRFGARERKRPRDRLLRDAATRRVVLELRKRSAFLGYTWRRRRPGRGEVAVWGGHWGGLGSGAAPEADEGAEAGGPGAFAVSRSAAGDIAAVRALHRGRLSMN